MYSDFLDPVSRLDDSDHCRSLPIFVNEDKWHVYERIFCMIVSSHYVTIRVIERVPFPAIMSTNQISTLKVMKLSSYKEHIYERLYDPRIAACHYLFPLHYFTEARRKTVPYIPTHRTWFYGALDKIFHVNFYYLSLLKIK